MENREINTGKGDRDDGINIFHIVVYPLDKHLIKMM